jgi:hypothetical protein
VTPAPPVVVAQQRYNSTRMGDAHVRGRLKRKIMNPGSKSEAPGFVLEMPDGTQLPVEHRADNPFEPRSLEPLADRRVEATGQLYRGRLLVDEIHSVD